VLEIAGVSVRFDRVDALNDVSLDVERGSTLGLIGPNGSGKTSLLNAITGLYGLSSGEIVWDGGRLSGQPPFAIAQRGIARTFQNLRFFPHLTVLDNVEAAQLPTKRSRRRSRRAEAMALLEHVGLAHRGEDIIESLPLADQRRLDLARALASKPDLLLLDEPAGGMTPVEVEAMAELLRSVALGGRTCVIGEHKMNRIRALCVRVCALNFGHKIVEGTPDDVLAHRDVQEAYLGVEADFDA